MKLASFAFFLIVSLCICSCQRHLSKDIGCTFSKTDNLPSVQALNSVNLSDLKRVIRMSAIETLMGSHREIQSSNFLKEHSDRLIFLRNPESVRVWLYDKSTYVIAVWDESDFRSDRLIDLFTFRPREWLFPQIKGEYEDKLRSVKVGTTLADLQQLLGRITYGRYYQDSGGVWRVELEYYGVDSEVWAFEFDAGKGVLSKVSFLTMP